MRDNRDNEAAWRKLHAHCMEVIRDAVRYRPPTVLKFGFFDRLLQQSLPQQATATASDASPPLLTGLKLVNLLLVR